MLSDYLHFLKIISLLVGVIGSLSAGDFVTPAEGPVAFRRDRVPLDAETMIKLSAQLTTLAGGLAGETPAERRTAAQMLALAIALDPASSRARTVLEKFETGTHQREADSEKISKTQDSIWATLDWLENPEAGADGQALASCVKDVLAGAAPDDPRTADLRSAGERGKWAGWVADIAAFEMANIPVAPAPNDGEVERPKSKPGILLKEATVYLPLWQKVPNSDPERWKFASVPLNMKAGPNRQNDDAEDEEDRPFSLTIGRPTEDENGISYPLAALIPVIQDLLLREHGQLPENCRVRIDSPELEESLKANKRQSLSAAVAVLASAAISGREPDAAIIGQIDSMGAFKLPTGFWDQLRALMKEKGKRLILPAAAAPYLQSVLAVEYPQFFLNNEVLLASNFKELLDLSAKFPDAATEKILSQFQEIQAKAGNQPTGQYVANSFVRRRLIEIAKAAPYHASANMLAIQAAGNRPITITQPVLKAELRNAIEPMEWVFAREEYYFQATEINRIGATFETCSGELKRLERYVEKGDRELMERVGEMVALLRSLDRAARARTGPDEWTTINTLQTCFSDLAKAYRAITAELAELPAGVAPAPDR